MATDLSRPSDEFIDFLVHTGRFASRSDALEQAIHLLQDQEAKQRIQKGIDEIENGQGIHLNSDEELREFFEEIKRSGRERARARQAGQS